MNNYSYKSIVSNTEAEALKEMIFKRARERAEVLNEETQSSYTTAVHADIMDLARESFQTNKNPFIFESEPIKDTVVEEKVTDVEETTSEKEIGFSQRKVENIKSQIAYKNKIYTEKVSEIAIQSAMNDARKDLYKKQSFVGALEFLNSQATISLIKTKGQSFEALV